MEAETFQNEQLMMQLPSSSIPGYYYDDKKQRYFKGNRMETPIEKSNTAFQPIQVHIQSREISTVRSKYFFSCKCRELMFTQKPFVTMTNISHSHLPITNFSWDNIRLLACIARSNGEVSLSKFSVDTVNDNERKLALISNHQLLVAPFNVTSTLIKPNSNMYAITLLGDGLYAGCIEICTENLLNSEIIKFRHYAPKNNPVWCGSFSNIKDILAFGSLGCFNIVDIHSQDVISKKEIFTKSDILCQTFDGHTLLNGARNGHVYIYDVRESSVTRSFQVQSSALTNIIMINNDIVTTSMNGTLKKFDTRYYKSVWDQWIGNGRISIDSQNEMLVTCNAGLVKIFSINQVMEKKVIPASLESTAKFHDEKSLIVSCNEKLQIWDFNV